MTFDVYFPFKNKEGKVCPGVRAVPYTISQIIELTKSDNVRKLVDEVRSGNKEAKKELPAVCWIGRTKSGKRIDSDMEPTQLVMIDIDHVKEPREFYKKLSLPEFKPLLENEIYVVLAHVTPSGEGLRIIFRASEPFETVSEHMVWFRDTYIPSEYIEDFDVSVKNLGRLSFLVPFEDIITINSAFLDGSQDLDVKPIKSAGGSIEKKQKVSKTDDNSQRLFSDNSFVAFTDNERNEFESFRYKGFEIKSIIRKYLEVFGEPGTGEKHNYYNEMVKNFRNILDNNKRMLLYFLPDFGHSLEERWSQIVSICRVNTLSRLPKQFYFFLKDNGFYQQTGTRVDDLKEYMMSDNPEDVIKPPFLPPVFRELVGTAPNDFIVPAVNALLPILGTLTSYLRAKYPYDNRTHSTSFFSVIYAPPGTGKGFVERYMELLFEDLRLRDYVESERENVYLRVLNRRSQQDKAPEMPHVSLRLIPPKNSEAEFLQKQRDNQGFHMFTYAAEMDSWAKGVRAAGGNKDDMIRIAWDNGEYGQQFKSANTFKGMVNLYWNVLITGTLAQLETYFKNVENGLVTRCSFCGIENQEFKLPPTWRKISKRGMETIKAFTERCDRRTYETPCTLTFQDIDLVSDEDFDKEIDWKFKFREKITVDLDWIMPVIEKFHNEQMSLAARDVDRARDVFRRRVGVRGFRLALLCEGLWEKPTNKDRENCKLFIDWWMHRDLENMMKLWGTRYNELTETVVKICQRTVFDALPEKFERADVYSVCLKQGIKTPVRRILFDWKKLNYVKQEDKEHFVKITKKKP